MQIQKILEFTFSLLLIFSELINVPSKSNQDGLMLEYSISNIGNRGELQHVSLNISNIHDQNLELIISPMEGFDMESRSNTTWYFVDEIQAFSLDGDELEVINKGQLTVKYLYFGMPIHYKGYSIKTEGNEEIIIEYDISECIYAGFLETILLRPKNQDEIQKAIVSFEIDDEWIAVTVATDQINDFDLGTLEMMYGSNDDLAKNYVPYGYIVAKENEVEIVKSKYGRLLITNFPNPLTGSLENPDLQLSAAGKMFDYFYEEIGPLPPFNSRVVYNILWPTWGIQGQIQPGLYSEYWQHNRTIDLSSGEPPYKFYNWEMKDREFGQTVIDWPPFSYSHYAHTLARGWFNSGLIRSSYSEPNWFQKSGLIFYFQEDSLSVVYGKYKVYERWKDIFDYYMNSYVNTEKDKPIMNPGSDNFIKKYKSELWAFYLNQRIIEETNGHSDIGVVIRQLYSEYEGSEKAYTLKDFERIVNEVVGDGNVSDLFDKYLYTNTALPLDYYFADDDQDGLANGLETELGYDPYNSDSDEDGIDDANEYYKYCMDNVVNNEYCIEAVPEGSRIPNIAPTIEKKETITPLSTLTTFPVEGIDKSKEINNQNIYLISGLIGIISIVIYIFIRHKKLK